MVMKHGRNKAKIDGVVNERGDTALHVAAQDGDHETVSSLLQDGAEVNARNAQSYTPLHFAHDAETIRLLLDHGADIAAMNVNSQTPLGRYIDYYNDTAAYALLDAAGPAALSAPVNAAGYTPLHMAIMKKNPDLVAFLVARGAEVNSLDGTRRSPLCRAVEFGDKTSVELLVRNGANVNKLEIAPLEAMMTAKAYDEDMLKLLLKLGADPAASDLLGGRLLCKAVRNNRMDLFIDLLKAGANINARDASGHTPLALAVRGGIPGYVEYMLDNGADPNFTGGEDRPPLYNVSNNRENARIVELLANAGADLQWADRDGGNTVLHFIDDMTAAETVAALVKHGADIEAKNNIGMTPLHCAAARGQGTAVYNLRWTGASLFARDKNGMTAADIAKDRGHDMLADRLKAEEDKLVADARRGRTGPRGPGA